MESCLLVCLVGLGAALFFMIAEIVVRIVMAGGKLYRRLVKDKKTQPPKIIIVRGGPPKRSAVDILMHPEPMPKWKPVDNILTPVPTPSNWSPFEDIAIPKGHITTYKINLKKPKTSDPRKRRNQAKCKKSCRP